MATNLLLHPIDRPRQRFRRDTLRGTLRPLWHLIAGKRVLDFGASSGLSMLALLEAGAAEVVGVEPDADRVELGREILDGRGELLHVSDTRDLPLPDTSFDVVLCNAVLEHIPQPRDAYIREMWRCLKPNGVLIVNETPNKYLPADFHTTKLALVNWLPCRLAYDYAVWRGRYRKSFEGWQGSGWRGLGYYEMVAPLTGYTLVPESSKLRHRLLNAIGLPASLCDPYPLWIMRKR